jgi:hypothetical protein
MSVLPARTFAPLALANTCPATSAARGLDTKVVARQGVTVLAEFLFGVLRRWPITAKDVHVVWNGIQVPRIDTRGLATKVIWNEMVGYQPYEVLIRDAVCEYGPISDLYSSATFLGGGWHDPAGKGIRAQPMR